MRRAIIFCLAFGLVLVMVNKTMGTNHENISSRMQFQEINIGREGVAETKADYFTGNNRRAVIFGSCVPGKHRKEAWRSRCSPGD